MRRGTRGIRRRWEGGREGGKEEGKGGEERGRE
jgi:hypothetical protein